ncbi:hypothetical protein [Chelatococcus reniformis]|uniref:Uncharacterized protein n=1 Tax=Chelatococcus reniformis TaxID=1494448 RepID=A0A916U212_9HYPH|nr:hypothetical protein [Chelatococcus reniformis]GGC55325.1 hypothetical protein GCM10010994_12770 [Chelatococcus reniformis]
MRTAFSLSSLPLAAALVAALAVGACQSTTTRKEDMMAAAGFKIRLADTPEKLANLQKLPPNTFVPRTVNGQTVFVYADPLVCKCLYYGSQQAFQTFQGLNFEQRISSQDLLAAQMNADATWDYGVWGPGWWY